MFPNEKKGKITTENNYIYFFVKLYVDDDLDACDLLRAKNIKSLGNNDFFFFFGPLASGDDSVSVLLPCIDAFGLVILGTAAADDMRSYFFESFFSSKLGVGIFVEFTP